MSGREAAERKAREDEIKIETEVERRMKEELARRDKEAARQAREEADRKAREEAQRQARERKAREEAQKQAREEAEKKAREDKIKFEIEVERRVREELEKRDIEAARLATEESQRIAREQQLKQREKEEQENRDREEREREEQKEMQLRQKEPRRVLKQYMNNHEFAKLQQWLEQSRNQLEALFEAGDVPVVGWLQLAETIKCSEVNRARLEVEWDENARNCEQIQQQIRTLREELAKLANRDSQILEETKKMTEILSLTSEMDAIRMLGKKEQMAVAKVELKMKNEYFLGDLEFDDVSTAFSMFEMDGMFSRFKKNETNSNLEVVVNASVTYLQHYMELEFPEAVEMLFKFKLFENGEKGVERHLGSCSICSSTKLDVLLKEYEMTEDEMKQIQEKIKEWKGYYVVIMNAMGGSLEIPAGSLRSKLATCLMRIQKVHKWKRDYGVTPVSQ